MFFFKAYPVGSQMESFRPGSEHFPGDFRILLRTLVDLVETTKYEKMQRNKKRKTKYFQSKFKHNVKKAAKTLHKMIKKD